MSFAIRRIHSMSGPMIAAVALVASMWFAARAARSWLAPATDERGDVRVDAARVAVVAPPAEVTPAAAAHDADSLVARNMFCATCTPPGPGPGPGAPGPRASRFTGQLVATHVETATRGTATILDAATGAGGAYRLGAIVPGGATLAVVRRDGIDVRFPDGAIETVSLFARTQPGTPDTTAGATAATGAAAPSDPWADRVRDLGQGRFEIDRRLIHELVGAAAGGKVAGVRLAPVLRDGELAGIRVVSARPGSVARALGLEPGDVIEGVDGRALTSTEALMTLYGQLDSMRHVSLAVRRKRGSRLLAYDLR